MTVIPRERKRTGALMRINVSSGIMPAGISVCTTLKLEQAKAQPTREAAAASTKLSTRS